MRMNRVLPNALVRRQHTESADNGLTNEDPVKGVLVKIGQLGEIQSRLLVQRKRLDIVHLSLLGNIFFGGLRQWQFAQFVLYGDFPGRGHAQIDVIFGVDKKALCLG